MTRRQIKRKYLWPPKSKCPVCNEGFFFSDHGTVAACQNHECPEFGVRHSRREG